MPEASASEKNLSETASVVLRRCGPDDATMLSILGQATFLDAFAGILEGPDIIGHCSKQHGVEKYRELLASADSASYVAETVAGRAPVGYMVMDSPKLPVPDPDDGDVELKRIYVLSRFHGAGVGPLLMDKAIQWAREKGKKRVLLGVYDENRRALAFYKKNRFEIIGERQFLVGRTLCRDFVLARVL